ncbi:MAG: Uma2 family endonuclease [Fimbriimonadales bacterium]|nr:Uma2 family endonuclease [Fimbriimonadales bacterium]
MATAVGQRMSVEEFERAYMGKRAELWRGEVREYMPAGARHGEIAMSIGAEVRAFVRQYGLGKTYAAETGFVLRTPAGESVLAPDAAFIRKERLPEGEPAKGFSRVAPDLVVEVVSPDDSYNKVREKVGEWLAGGVQVVWVVDPERRVVEVWLPPHELTQVLTETDTLRGEPVLPGFELPVRVIFE